MKKIITFLVLIISAINTYGQSAVVVSTDGAVLYPSNFIEANGIATEAYVDEVVLSITGNGDIDLGGYYTKIETNAAISAAVDGLATEAYVTSAINAIDVSETDLSNYYDKSETNSAISTAVDGLATEAYVTSAINAIDVSELDLGEIELDIEEIQEELIPKSSLSVFIDLYRDGMDDVGGNGNTYSYVYGSYYSDCILKVLDPEGNLLYFFSTISYSSDYLQSMHDKGIYDNTAIVYYYPTGRNNDNTNGTTKLRAKTLFPSTAWTTHCIATYEESFSGQSVYNGITSVSDSKIRITAIQIYPSEEFHSVFLNPENTIVTNRQSIYTAELDGKGSHLFRPAIIQYLR